MSGKGTSPGGWLAMEHAPQHTGHVIRPSGVKKTFGQHSQTQSLNFEWPCGVGFGDPWWSLPTCFILWFCDNYRTFLGLYIYICCWNKQYLQDSRKLVLEQFILIVVYAYTVWICGCKFSHSLRKSEHVGLTQGRISWLVPQYSIHLCKIHFSFVADGLFVTTHRRKKNGRLNWSSIIGIFHEPSLK